MSHEPLTVREWTDVVRRARLGRTVKAVAMVAATYADADGTRIFPGIARLAVDCEITYNVAQNALATLRKVGLIERVVFGTRRKGHADEYRLTLHPDLLDRVEVLTPGQVTLAAQKLRNARPSRAGKSRAASPTQEALDGLDPTAWGANTVAADADTAVLDPTPCGAEPGLDPTGRGPNADDLDPTAWGPNSGLDPTPNGPNGSTANGFGPHGDVSKTGFGPHGDVPLDPTPWDPTIQDLDTTTTSHTEAGVDLDVTAPRAQAEPQDQIFSPARCTHGFRRRLRADGTSACALCRVAVRIGALTEPSGQHRILPGGAA